MTEEKKEITSKTVGYSFHISVEKESRIETGAKYPDKIVTKASLGGHEETFVKAYEKLKLASEHVRKQLEEINDNE